MVRYYSSETFNSFTTNTYTLAHLHTPTMYTFVILTDPVVSPSAIPGAAGGNRASNEGYSIGSAGPASGRSFGTGGGIPGTGGMSLKGVLLQIYRGPWVDTVVKNPLSRALEREERVVEPDQDFDEEEGDGAGEKIKVTRERRVERSQGIDTDAFRESLEKGKSHALIGNVVHLSWFEFDLLLFLHPSTIVHQSCKRTNCPHRHRRPPRSYSIQLALQKKLFHCGNRTISSLSDRVTVLRRGGSKRV